MILFLLVWTVIATTIVYYIQKRKKDLAIKEKEIIDQLFELRPIALSAHKKILKEIEWKYLNNKLYDNLKNKHRETYELVQSYEDYLYEECFLIYDFFQSQSFRNQHNKEYTIDCRESYEQYYIDLDDNGYGLTWKQLEAVFCDEDATLVNAWAGTGKTKTIESKLLHLIDHREIPIDEILVMTFSKKSQEDMMQRIRTSLDKAWIIYNNDSLKDTISTFHAFWKKILDEECFVDEPTTWWKKDREVR